MNFLAIHTSNFFCILLFFNLFSGCETDKQQTGDSMVNLAVLEPTKSDDSIAALFISIKKIELKGNEGWITYKQFNDPLQINLLDNKTSKNYFLGEKLLPAGQYMEARLILEGNNKEENDLIVTSGCYLQYNNGEFKSVYIPQDSKNGILAKGKFNLPAEGVVNITLNFDIREGLTETSASGKYLLKPKIKMIVNNDTGVIEGEFEEKNSFNKIAVFAYTSNSYSKSDFFNPAFQEDKLAKSSSSSILNEDGKFILSFLKSGNYDLYFYAYDEEGNFHSLIGSLDNIEIEGGQKTIVKVPKEVLHD